MDSVLLFVVELIEYVIEARLLLLLLLLRLLLLII